MPEAITSVEYKTENLQNISCLCNLINLNVLRIEQKKRKEKKKPYNEIYAELEMK